MGISLNSDSNSRVTVNDSQGIDLITNNSPRFRMETTGLQSSVVPDLSGSNINLFPSFACRAWVNFDGTRDTTGASSTANTNRLIRASGNVLSVLRNGTGDYTITFTIPMPDANYSYSGNVYSSDNLTPSFAYSLHASNSVLPTVNGFRFLNGRNRTDSNFTLTDFTMIMIAVFR